jgi:amidase
MAGLWRMSATELATLIRDRQVSAREVIETHLRRIDAVNPALNAIVIRLDEQALAAADAADRAVAAGDQLPPLHGVPSRSRLAARTSPRSPFGGTAKASQGHTVSPWDATRTLGASSGGDAVAVATGMTPLGLGGMGWDHCAGPPSCFARGRHPGSFEATRSRRHHLTSFTEARSVSLGGQGRMA